MGRDAEVVVAPPQNVHPEVARFPGVAVHARAPLAEGPVQVHLHRERLLVARLLEGALGDERQGGAGEDRADEDRDGALSAFQGSPFRSGRTGTRGCFRLAPQRDVRQARREPLFPEAEAPPQSDQEEARRSEPT